MKPIQDIEVIPFLPPALEPLRELAYNLRWTWEHEIIKLFVRLDDELWESCGHNPASMLGLISQEKLHHIANDAGFISQLNRVYHKHQEYMRNENTWYKRQFKPSNQVIAYFSAEFGLSEAMPIYSGGLGVLAGDHIKAASELGLPLVGVGIIYQEGYFRQYLTQDGWQQERYPINDFYNMPIMQVKEKDGSPVTVSLDFPGRKVYAQIWQAQVGRVPLYLLDTNIQLNNQADQDITDALYHGDNDLRFKQELILGVAGIRALTALGIIPTVCHMNEGHSAFLGLERIRMLIKENNISFFEAKEVAAAGQVFTTHTAVPAGIDKFSTELIDRYWGDFYKDFGISRDEFLALGRSNPRDNSEPFSMALLAINLSSKRNAVSKLHGDVSRQLFSNAWPNVPVDEVPISHITNGIHARSWISGEICELYERYLGPQWYEEITNERVWKRVEEIPDEELWRIHEHRRQRLVSFCRNRFRGQLIEQGAHPAELKEASEILDPGILTIGFGRRVATYKRANLLLKNPERLIAILNNKDFPVQLIFAGKAHPEDSPGKELIRQIVRFSRQKEIRRRFVFLEDYDMNVARWMAGGVDVWLNTPRRFLEASGTSGMKVAFNGGLNLSILDGWWDEAYEPDIGWAIGQGEVYGDIEYQDEVESNALYDLLEKEIIPSFYERDQEDLPRSWITRMKTSIRKLCPVFNIERMVQEYAFNMYVPCGMRSLEFLANGAERARELVAWQNKIIKLWPQLQIGSVESSVNRAIKVGDDLTVRAWIKLGDLTAEDVAVEIYHGLIDANGEIKEGEVLPMQITSEKKGQLSLFAGTIKYFKSGRHGYTIRILPYAHDQTSPFDSHLILWAQEPVTVAV